MDPFACEGLHDERMFRSCEEYVNFTEDQLIRVDQQVVHVVIERYTMVWVNTRFWLVVGGGRYVRDDARWGGVQYHPIMDNAGVNRPMRSEARRASSNLFGEYTFS